MQVEVEFVREAVHEQMGGECYEVATLVTWDDGRTDRLLRVMPVWTVAARMAEYNCSQAQAVRLILAEQYVPVDGLPSVLTDPLWRRGAEQHVQVAEQTFAGLGFRPLDARAEDRPADPTALMRQREWPADFVRELRGVVADQRQALRERADPAPAPAEVAMPTG